MVQTSVDTLKLIVCSRGPMEPTCWPQLNYDNENLALPAHLTADAGLTSAAHAYTPKAVMLAARHGFHAIYHSNVAEEEALDMIEARKDGILVAPCVGILVFDVRESFATRHATEAIGALEAVKGQCRAIPEMHRRGIQVLPGGDYGFPWSPVGRNARDIEHFVQLFGFALAEALRAVT
jgi:imidazolonepropionase-like amidohydrolase